MASLNEHLDAEEDRPLHFLIVDDDRDYADYLGLLVGESFPGNTIVEIASSVSEALKMLTDGTFDVCFLDYFLGTHTGLDVLRTMAFRDTSTAFVFLTSNERREAAAEALHFGAMDYLIKSNFAPFELIKAVSFAIYRKRREIELRKGALRDPLTGLGNRALFDEQLRTSIARADRNGEKLGVAIIDLDGFKPVNDQHGHQAGDEVLRQIAHRIDGEVRKSDITARIGGDEFAVIFFGVKDPAILHEIGGKLIEAIGGTPFALANGEVTVGASLGLAVFPEDARNAVELVGIADARMYENKKEHKGGR